LDDAEATNAFGKPVSGATITDWAIACFASYKSRINACAERFA